VSERLIPVFSRGLYAISRSKRRSANDVEMSWRCLFSVVDGFIAKSKDAPAPSMTGFRILGVVVEEMRRCLEDAESPGTYKPSQEVQAMVVGTIRSFLDATSASGGADYSDAVQVARIGCLKHLFSLSQVLSGTGVSASSLRKTLESSAASVLIHYAKRHSKKLSRSNTMTSEDEDGDADVRGDAAARDGDAVAASLTMEVLFVLRELNGMAMSSSALYGALCDLILVDDLEVREEVRSVLIAYGRKS